VRTLPENKAVKDVLKGVEGRSDAAEYRSILEYFVRNMEPFPESDVDLLELGFRCCAEGRLSDLRQLRQMSSVISDIRVGEVFNSPILLKDADLSALPANVSPAITEGRSQAARLQKMVAEGLGLSIPREIPIDIYIELVRDYQPEICKTIKSILGSGGGEASILDASRSIIAINTEIERIRNLRRYVVLEASLGFYRNNRMLTNATLIAGALGLTGSLFGCAVVGGTALGSHLAKKKGWLKGSEAVERLRRLIARDLQPAVDLVLKAYLGASAPAINVLSIRKRVQSAELNASPRRVA
jgi:hypothetical protein